MVNRLLIFVIIAIQLSCFHSDTTNIRNVSNSNSNFPEKPPSISADKAVSIAQDYLSKNRNMQDFQPSVETENELFKEYGEMWRVTFRSKINEPSEKPDRPIVWIFKTDGKVFTRDQIK